MIITKNDMARIIVQVSRNLKELPPADHFEVIKIAKRPKRGIEPLYNTGIKILEEKIRKELYK